MVFLIKGREIEEKRRSCDVPLVSLALSFPTVKRGRERERERESSNVYL
jgi:hypothetical protein